MCIPRHMLCTEVRTYIYMYVHMYMYVCMYVLCICTYVYIYGVYMYIDENLNKCAECCGLFERHTQLYSDILEGRRGRGRGRG